MHSRWIAPALAAGLAGCSNNNIVVSGTANMPTLGSSDDGAASEITGGTPSGGSTAAPETTALTDAASGTSTGAGGDTNNAGTTNPDTGDTAADTTDTTSGEPVGPPRYAVFNHCEALNFHVVDLEDQWSIVTPKIPNVTAQMAVGVSNEHVYYYSQATKVVSRYAFATATWLPHLAGPAAITTSRGWVEWVGGNNVCMAFEGRDELYCHDGDAWRTIQLTVKADAWASYDPDEHELYVKVRDNVGFQVVDLDTYEIVRTVPGSPHNIYQNCLFDYHDGYVYIDDFPNMHRLDSHTGDSTPFAVPTLEDEARRGSGVHPATSKIYVTSDINFYAGTPIREYDFASQQVTLLPYEPMLFDSFRVVFQPYN